MQVSFEKRLVTIAILPFVVWVFGIFGIFRIVMRRVFWPLNGGVGLMSVGVLLGKAVNIECDMCIQIQTSSDLCSTNSRRGGVQQDKHTVKQVCCYVYTHLNMAQSHIGMETYTYTVVYETLPRGVYKYMCIQIQACRHTHIHLYMACCHVYLDVYIYICICHTIKQVCTHKYRPYIKSKRYADIHVYDTLSNRYVDISNVLSNR